MKIILPESIADITLDQYQKYEALCARTDLDAHNFNQRKIAIFTGMKYRDVGGIVPEDYTSILDQIDTALNQDAPFVSTFTLNGVELGFIPNLNKMTMAEFVDLAKYQAEKESLNRVAAILFRPVISKDAFGNYTIAEYIGTEETAEAMRRMPMSIVNGMLVFFSSLSNECMNYIQNYMQGEQQREVQQLITSLSGGGTLR